MAFSCRPMHKICGKIKTILWRASPNIEICFMIETHTANVERPTEREDGEEKETIHPFTQPKGGSGCQSTDVHAEDRSHFQHTIRGMDLCANTHWKWEHFN